MSGSVERREPDFILMVALVVACLAVGGIVLAVVPRPVPPVKSAAVGPAAQVAAPVNAEADPAACVGDGSIPDGLVVGLPARAVAHRMFQLSGLSETQKVAALWQSRYATDMGPELEKSGLRACAYRAWDGGPCGNCFGTATVVRFQDAATALHMRDVATSDLPKAPTAGDVFAFEQLGNVWVEGDRGGGFPEDVAVMARGEYLAFIQVSPGGPQAQALLQDLARQQYTLLRSA
jgi:hypothetical protein